MWKGFGVFEVCPCYSMCQSVCKSPCLHVCVFVFVWVCFCLSDKCVGVCVRVCDFLWCVRNLTKPQIALLSFPFHRAFCSACNQYTSLNPTVRLRTVTDHFWRAWMDRQTMNGAPPQDAWWENDSLFFSHRQRNVNLAEHTSPIWWGVIKWTANRMHPGDGVSQRLPCSVA